MNMIDTYDEYEDLIPLPRMSDYLSGEFMMPMNLTAEEVSKGTEIPLHEIRALLADDAEITPEISEKLGRFFGVSAMLFYDIQQDLLARKQQDYYRPILKVNAELEFA